MCGWGCINPQIDDHHCGDCDIDCPDGAHCVAAQCVCDDDSRTLCTDQCVNTNNDRRNCGGCGVACASDERCRGGACEED